MMTGTLPGANPTFLVTLTKKICCFSLSDLELPNYVHEKVNVIEITDMEVTSGLKGMNKGRAPGWDYMRAEMVDVAGEIGVRWTKRLLNACMRQCKVSEDWRIGLIVPMHKTQGSTEE